MLDTMDIDMGDLVDIVIVMVRGLQNQVTDMVDLGPVMGFMGLVMEDIGAITEPMDLAMVVIAFGRDTVQ